MKGWFIIATIRLQQNRINPLVLPVILAKERGIFEKHDVDVMLELADDFIFQGKAAFLNGEVDAQMGDTTFFFYYLKDGKDAVITSTLTRTIQLAGYKNSKYLTDFRVGINRTGLFRFFAETYLYDVLPKTSYVYINNTYERMEKLKAHQIDGLVAIDPFISEVLAIPDTEVIWHSNELDACYVMWCFDANFVKENPQDVKNFHLALEEAQSYFNHQTSEEKINLLTNYCHLPIEKAQAFAEFNYEEQRNYSELDFMLLQEWLFKSQEIVGKISPTKGIFKTF